MKMIAFTVYVVSVLLTSLFASANATSLSGYSQIQYQTPVQISQVAFSETKIMLFVGGSLPSPCYGQPSSLMTQDHNNPNVLTVRLSSPTPMRTCVMQIKNFTTEVDLALLAQISQVRISPDQTYLIKVEGSEYEFQISGVDLI